MRVKEVRASEGKEIGVRSSSEKIEMRTTGEGNRGEGTS